MIDSTPSHTTKKEIMKNKKTGFVYVAKFRNNFSGTIKIGMTNKSNPRDREKGLNSTSLPDHMDMVKVWAVADAREIESRIHKDPALKKFRTDGKEWFTVSVEDAIAICDKYCIQFTNDRFKTLWNEFSRASRLDQDLFYTLLFKRSMAVRYFLTEWEQDNPGQQDINRRQTAVGLAPDKFRDIITFWQEWQGLSQSFRQFIQQRPCDGVAYRGGIEHHPNDVYYNDVEPYKPHQAITRESMEWQLARYRDELRCWFRGDTKSIQWYISQHLLKGKPKKQDFYSVRMEPQAKLIEFKGTIDPDRVDGLIENDYITPTRKVLEQQVIEEEKQLLEQAKEDNARSWKEQKQRKKMEKAQEWSRRKEVRETMEWEDRMQSGGIKLTIGILLSIYLLAMLASN